MAREIMLGDCIFAGWVNLSLLKISSLIWVYSVPTIYITIVNYLYSADGDKLYLVTTSLQWLHCFAPAIEA